MILFFILALLVAPAKAENLDTMYVYKAIRIIDGDTIALNVENEKPLIQKLGLSVRIRGIDTPEKAPRAKCEKENILAQKASNYTKNSIEKAQKNRQKITFSEIKWDKYGGRIVAKVMINESDLGQELVRNGLARIYNGEKKKSWCNNTPTLK